jgi:Glycosyltransferase sugar-binding region containing DXD motif
VSFPVWEYWEGPMPGYVELCIETVRRHYPDVRVLDPASFDELWQVDRDVPIDHLLPQQRADFVRVYLLHHHGGLWLDGDFVLLRPFDELAELPPEITFAGYRVDGGDFSNGLIFSRPGDPVLRDFYTNVCERLRERRPIGWYEIGATALKPAVEAHPEAVFELGPDLVSPVPWHQVRSLEEPGDAAALVAPGRWGVILANATSSAELREKTRDGVLGDGSVLGDLIRRALAG